ncbi:glycosyl transferase family 90 [Azorhizobium doebereinerae]|uniref:glycosyl transferase family 90 n=1 Tax=Azorhizobium doebereinerae TaxID=281091 RepID=UPI0006864D7C|nr:glycosyl transferase family 90 [Azorhizobium doebereinerae]
MAALSDLLFRAAPGWAIRLAVGARFSTVVPAGRRVRVLAGDPQDARLTFENDGRWFTATAGGALLTREGINSLWKRGAVMAYFASRSAADAVEASLADHSSQPGVLTFCSNHPDAVLIPDRAFMTPRVYAPYREVAQSVPWDAREDVVRWRGAPSGQGEITHAWMDPANPLLRQRVRMCLALKDMPGVDVAFAGRADLAPYGISRERIGPLEWAKVRFAVDVDGFSAAWMNFYSRLLLGCCVIKITSPYGFRQWFYDALVPWIHYVPVKADLSDLPEKIAWCRANTDACRQIAEEGQRFALARTPETETPLTLARIDAALGARSAASAPNPQLRGYKS